MKKKLIAAVVLTSFIALPSADAATLSANQKSQLQYLIEEEKLARDVYNYLGTKVTTQKFSNIARSEQMHMDQIQTLLNAYNVADPTVGKAAGQFKNKDLAALYKKLIKQGSTSTTSAFGAGVTIEKMDIADLVKIRKIFTQQDVLSAIDLLARGSQNHLRAFTR